MKNEMRREGGERTVEVVPSALALRLQDESVRVGLGPCDDRR